MFRLQTGKKQQVQENDTSHGVDWMDEGFGNKYHLFLKASHI